MSGGNRIQTPRLCLWRASHESRTQTPIQFFVDVHERKNACMLREEGGGDSRFRARGKELQI